MMSLEHIRFAFTTQSILAKKTGKEIGSKIGSKLVWPWTNPRTTKKEQIRECPFCDCGPNCSPTYICEGCFHEKIAAIEKERDALAIRLTSLGIDEEEKPLAGLDKLKFLSEP